MYISAFELMNAYWMFLPLNFFSLPLPLLLPSLSFFMKTLSFLFSPIPLFPPGLFNLHSSQGKQGFYLQKSNDYKIIVRDVRRQCTINWLLKTRCVLTSKRIWGSLSALCCLWNWIEKAFCGIQDGLSKTCSSCFGQVTNFTLHPIIQSGHQAFHQDFGSITGVIWANPLGRQ